MDISPDRITEVVFMSQSMKYFGRTRPELVSFLPSFQNDARILEIGCGSGMFRQHISQECTYWGVEPVVDAAERAKTVLDRVLVGNYDTVAEQLPDAYFDCIIVADVIEHMPDVDWFLMDIKRKIKPGGYLTGSVPNVRYIKNLYHLIVEKDWRYVDAGILDRTHLRFFTNKSLNRLFNESEFHIDRLAGINEIGAYTKGIALIKHLIAKLMIYPVIGQDVKFLQFAFRVHT